MTTTDKQLSVIRFIDSHVADKGFAPTVQEVANFLGVTKKGGYDHLMALKRKGYVDWIPGLARTLRVIHRD